MNLSRRTFIELAGTTIVVAGTSLHAATKADGFRQVSELTIDDLIAKEFPSLCIQGPAVPGATVCPKDLENYHPPNDERALNYITRLCRLNTGDPLFTLQGVSGWNANSRALMASLSFTAKQSPVNRIHFEAEGNLQVVAGYKLKSWRIDTENDGKQITFVDRLTWLDGDANHVETSLRLSVVAHPIMH